VRRFLTITTVGAMVAGLLALALPQAMATKPDPNHRVTICHRTRAANHPYVQITVDEASVNGEDSNPASDHSHHDGPVPADLADAQAIKDAGGFWGDIIPPFYTNGSTSGVTWNSQNWTTEGQSIFEAGCRFPDETFVGLRIVKTVETGIIQEGESFSFSFVVTVKDGDPENPDDVVGSCDITIDSNSSIPGESSCVINGLDPNTEYDVYETNTGGFDPQLVQSVTTHDVGDENAGVEFDNTFDPATAQACKVTDVNGTGHDASTDSFEFTLYADGTDIETVTVAGGGSANDRVCTSFDAALDDNVNYTIAETDAPSGYSQDDFACDVNGTSVNSNTGFTPEYPDDADALFTCTATDSIEPANVTVKKVTNPVGHEAGWTFKLYGDGTLVSTVTTTGSGALDFGVTLQDGVHYTITEVGQTWWRSNGGSAQCSFTVSYPADSGRTFACTFTNTEFTNGLTIGYWKNHLANSTKNGSWTDSTCKTVPSGTSCSSNGPWTKQYLPKTVGGLTVNTIVLAGQVFANNDCGGSTGKSAINCLAAQLLAAELNLSNGANPCANGIIADSNTFLSGGTVGGVTGVNYAATPFGGAITSVQRNKAVSLKSALDTFNNGICPV
jgi:hypothetical protein